MKAQHRRIALGAALGAAILPLAALADEPAPPREKERNIVVVGDGQETLSIGLEGSELTIVTRDGDASTVRIVDMEQVGLLVRDGLEEAFAALQDLQLDAHMGRDNRLAFSHGDETFEVDVDAILAEVGGALKGLDLDHLDLADLDLDTGGWAGVRPRDPDLDELRAQLDELKLEVRRLQQELADRQP